MTWELLWAFGRYDLRLSEADFWQLTPREFALLAERCEARVRWRDLRAALAPWMMNALWATKKGKVELEELMVINMLAGGKDKAGGTPTDPDAATRNLQAKCHAAFAMVAETARDSNRRKG